MSYVTFDSKKRFTYKVEILQVFKPQTHEEREAKVERVRHDEPIVIGMEWFTSPAAARNYGSNRTGRSEWYNNIGKPTFEYRWFHIGTDEVMPRNFYPYGKWSEYQQRKVDLPQPYEPNLDYRVYKVPVSMDMSEAVQLPALKKLYEVE